MYRKPLILAIIVVILLAVVPMARAITFGQPDGNNHPNVGAMIVQEPDGVKYFYCSGTLIAPDVFLTAAHCTAAAAAYGAASDDVFVTFGSVFDENATLHPGTYYLNPNYGHDRHDQCGRNWCRTAISARESCLHGLRLSLPAGARHPLPLWPGGHGAVTRKAR